MFFRQGFRRELVQTTKIIFLGGQGKCVRSYATIGHISTQLSPQISDTANRPISGARCVCMYRSYILCAIQGCSIQAEFARLSLERDDIEEHRQSIIAKVREQELAYQKRRKGKSRPAIGRVRLLNEGLSIKHTPKERGPRLSVLSSINEMRINFLMRFKAFKVRVRECYELMKKGHRDIDWPLSAFVPRRPILANPLPG